jgi:hypothetical protein
MFHEFTELISGAKLHIGWCCLSRLHQRGGSVAVAQMA